MTGNVSVQRVHRAVSRIADQYRLPSPRPTFPIDPQHRRQLAFCVRYRRKWGGLDWFQVRVSALDRVADLRSPRHVDHVDADGA